jgi:antitoxin component YwqK of YwqJK toxin-antitoxin module
MKFLLFVLMISGSEMSISQTDCIHDTLFFENGKIELIFDFDTTNHEYCGVYISFDSTGIIESEGAYLSVDSIRCFMCYDDIYRKSSEKWEQYDHSKYATKVPVGEWKYYHDNGHLKEMGSYCEMVHEYSGLSYPIEWEGKSWPSPVAGYGTFEFLKDGIWEYYDRDGHNIKTEEYVCGQLVYLTERQ